MWSSTRRLIARPLSVGVVTVSSGCLLSGQHGATDRRPLRCEGEWGQGAALGLGLGLCAGGLGMGYFLGQGGRIKAADAKSSGLMRNITLTPAEHRILANTLKKDGEAGDADHIACVLEDLWLTLIRKCYDTTGERSNLLGRKIDFQDLKRLEQTAIHGEAELAWFTPLGKWIEAPGFLNRLDYNKDGMIDFKEFATLYLLVCLASQGRSDTLSRTTFLKTLRKLIEVRDSDLIPMNDFVYMCRLLALFGVLSRSMLERTATELETKPADGTQPFRPKVAPSCTKMKLARSTTRGGRRGPEMTVGKLLGTSSKLSLQIVFEYTFSKYNLDGSAYLDTDEFVVFAMEWIDWGCIGPSK
eukprot:TRINITY_DN83219_c0_g1_i1.p1 TRINITY_DN83219_c0_g1~~TRINITY_DN83219_c0_g1_i1.p1  ORF type:complete len:357 (+),score=56.52 TRINITY_DN83219_c0_g1_i1:76-1146(+)